MARINSIVCLAAFHALHIHRKRHIRLMTLPVAVSVHLVGGVYDKLVTAFSHAHTARPERQISAYTRKLRSSAMLPVFWILVHPDYCFFIVLIGVEIAAYHKVVFAADVYSAPYRQNIIYLLFRCDLTACRVVIAYREHFPAIGWHSVFVIIRSCIVYQSAALQKGICTVSILIHIRAYGRCWIINVVVSVYVIRKPQIRFNADLKGCDIVADLKAMWFCKDICNRTLTAIEYYVLSVSEGFLIYGFNTVGEVYPLSFRLGKGIYAYRLRAIGYPDSLSCKITLDDNIIDYNKPGFLYLLIHPACDIQRILSEAGHRGRYLDIIQLILIMETHITDLRHRIGDNYFCV